MSELRNTSLTDRLKAADEAKKSMLAKFRPKTTVTDPLFEERAAMRAAELAKVRTERQDAKEAARQAVLNSEAAVAQRAADEAEAALQAKRGARKERQALTKAEAKAKRDARYAARKQRQ